MSANERRAEIVKILEGRRSEQVKNLAFQLDVSVRTIKNDILVLTAEHPIETVRGNGGCVRLNQNCHTYQNQLTQK
ncbi:MAG: HTH domain-containing protein [Lentisphaerae bacterium]|nr:HTH domain-containing protein [Lentisphaerota bacterium]